MMPALGTQQQNGNILFNAKQHGHGTALAHLVNAVQGPGGPRLLRQLAPPSRRAAPGLPSPLRQQQAAAGCTSRLWQPVAGCPLRLSVAGDGQHRVPLNPLDGGAKGLAQRRHVVTRQAACVRCGGRAGACGGSGSMWMPHASWCKQPKSHATQRQWTTRSKPTHPAPAKPLSTAEKRRRQSPASRPAAAPRSEHSARMRPASKPRLNTTTYSSWSGSAAAPPAAATGSAAATAAASRHRDRAGSRRRRRRGRRCCCRCCVSIGSRVGKALPGSAARPGAAPGGCWELGLVGGQGAAMGVPHVEIWSDRAWEACKPLSNALTAQLGRFHAGCLLLTAAPAAHFPPPARQILAIATGPPRPPVPRMQLRAMPVALLPLLLLGALCAPAAAQRALPEQGERRRGRGAAGRGRRRPAAAAHLPLACSPDR